MIVSYMITKNAGVVGSDDGERNSMRDVRCAMCDMVEDGDDQILINLTGAFWTTYPDPARSPRGPSSELSVWEL